MLYEKHGDWFVYCDGEGCKAELPFYYGSKTSAICDINEAKWELMPDNKCYCLKCVKKGD